MKDREAIKLLKRIYEWNQYTPMRGQFVPNLAAWNKIMQDVEKLLAEVHE